MRKNKFEVQYRRLKTLDESTQGQDLQRISPRYLNMEIRAFVQTVRDITPAARILMVAAACILAIIGQFLFVEANGDAYVGQTSERCSMTFSG